MGAVSSAPTIETRRRGPEFQPPEDDTVIAMRDPAERVRGTVPARGMVPGRGTFPGIVRQHYALPDPSAPLQGPQPALVRPAIEPAPARSVADPAPSWSTSGRLRSVVPQSPPKGSRARDFHFEEAYQYWFQHQPGVNSHTRVKGGGINDVSTATENIEIKRSTAHGIREGAAQLEEYSRDEKLRGKKKVLILFGAVLPPDKLREKAELYPNIEFRWFTDESELRECPYEEAVRKLRVYTMAEIKDMPPPPAKVIIQCAAMCKGTKRRCKNKVKVDGAFCHIHAGA